MRNISSPLYVHVSTEQKRDGGNMEVEKWREWQQDGEKKHCEINWAKVGEKTSIMTHQVERKTQLAAFPSVSTSCSGCHWGWGSAILITGEILRLGNNEIKQNLTKIMEMTIPSLPPSPENNIYIYASEWKQCNMTQNCLPHPTTSRWAILSIIRTWRGELEHKTIDLRPDPTQTGVWGDSNSSENPILTPFFLTCHGSRICHLYSIGMWCERAVYGQEQRGQTRRGGCGMVVVEWGEKPEPWFCVSRGLKPLCHHSHPITASWLVLKT